MNEGKSKSAETPTGGTNGDRLPPLRIAVVVKQVPGTEASGLGSDGRLVRTGVDLEMSAFCRRAVSKGVEFARTSGGTCTVLTLGPPSAEDCLREAIACGADEGVMISDVAFAGSDTLATARALARALTREGRFDLILAGRNSMDADTGQVGPQIAELLDLPFIPSARELEINGARLLARAEYDDGWRRLETAWPAVVATAERLCSPAKAPPEERQAVSTGRIRWLSAEDLGDGPWGQAGSPTSVTRVEDFEVHRERILLQGPIDQLAAEAVSLIVARRDDPEPESKPIPQLATRPPRRQNAVLLAALVEPTRERLARELVSAAADLAARLGGRCVALTTGTPSGDVLASSGADVIVEIIGAATEEDIAVAVSDWAETAAPAVILAPSSTWGRQVAARVAARIGAGLTGDATSLDLEDGRLVAWKPALGGRLMAAINASTPVQMATVRAGVLPLPPLRDRAPEYRELKVAPRGRVRTIERFQDDDPDALAAASVVIGIGQGVSPDDYGLFEPLKDLLGAELAATRKVTDRGWLPHSRQVGLTGASIAPELYVAVGLSGKINHTVGLLRARTIVAVNNDPEAPIFREADVGLVADWRDAIPALVDSLRARLADGGAASHPGHQPGARTGETK